MLRSVIQTSVLAVAAAVAWANAPSSRVPEAQIVASGGKRILLKDGRQLEYFDSGPHPSGKTILALAWGLGSGKCYVPFFSEAPARIISPSMPGYGGSDSHNGASLAAYGDDLRQLMDHLEIESFSIYGMSFGGIFAFATVLAMPQRIKAVSVIGAIVPKLPDFEGYFAVQPDAVSRGMNRVMATPIVNRAFVGVLFKAAFAMPYSDAVFAQLFPGDLFGDFERFPSNKKQALYETMGEAFRDNVDGLPNNVERSFDVNGSGLDYRRAGSLLKAVPVRVFVGSGDTVAVPENARYIVKALREGGATNVELNEVPGQGHLLCITRLVQTWGELVEE